MRLTVRDDPHTIARYRHVKAARRGKARCSVGEPGTGRSCTRPRGHTGPHVRHGVFGRVLAVWDSAVEVRMSAQTSKRASEARAGSGLLTRRRPWGLAALRGRLARVFSSVEETVFLVLFLAFVGFAVDWLLRILG